MALKYVINDPVEVPGPLRDYYKQTADGTYALALDGEPAGYVKADKLAEFRDNNRSLNAAKSELEAKLKAFDGIDPAEHAALKAKLTAFDGVDPDEYRALKARPDASQRAEELTAAKATLEAELTAEKAAHAAVVFKNAIGYEFLRLGGRANALDFIVSKAAETFTMNKDGKLTTKAFSAENPGTPLTVTEWVTSQFTAADFAFMPSKGGGATNSGGLPAKRTVSNDPLTIGQNLEAIARGNVTVS